MVVQSLDSHLNPISVVAATDRGVTDIELRGLYLADSGGHALDLKPVPELKT